MSDSDDLLAQGTVDFRNEERRHRMGRELQDLRSHEYLGREVDRLKRDLAASERVRRELAEAARWYRLSGSAALQEALAASDALDREAEA